MRRLQRSILCAGAITLLCVATAAAQTPKGGGKGGPGGKGGTPTSAPAAPVAPLVIDVAATRADLLGPDLDRAATAAQKLGQSRQPGVVDALLDGLSMGLHPKVAAAALAALAAQKDPRSLDVLLHYARNRNPGVRARAVTALGTLDDPRARTAVRVGLTDSDKGVRAAAAGVVAARKDVGAVDALLALFKKGDEATAAALAAIATADVARRVAELSGEAPDALVAQCLGEMLLRKDLGPEQVYVDIVDALGKVPGDDTVVALTAYIGSLPDKDNRKSKREAQAIYEQRMGGQ